MPEAQRRPGATRVVVVDDDLHQLRLIERTLEAEGFEVRSTAEPIGASNLVRAFQPDIVLLDVNIPALPGDRLLGLIRKVAPAHTRLVLHSSTDQESLRERARKVGADAWIQKNFEGGELASRLRRLLSQHP
ncbi:MAG: response regulator [Polyangiaceae bacterium]|nr:response regulator [Polyangiaceae bacterium]MCW5791591.1 response regulator [Polyangiaceae bacterium]